MYGYHGLYPLSVDGSATAATVLKVGQGTPVHRFEIDVRVCCFGPEEWVGRDAGCLALAGQRSRDPAGNS